MDLRELHQRTSATVIRHPWELARSEVVSRLLERTVGSSHVGSILDLGCGDTFLAEHISERFPGSTVTAVDTAFDDATRHSIEARIAGRPITLHDSLDQAQRCASTSVGLVLLLDVIEHVEDDVALLRSLRQYAFIRPDAWLLITAPAYQSLFCSHDRFLGHYRRYTNDSLAACARQAGYLPQRSGYFFTSLLLPRYLQVRRERSRAPTIETSGLVEWSGGAVRTSLLRNLLLFDFRNILGPPHRRDHASRPLELSVMPSLCLVVPCYNEASRLDAEAFLRCLREQPDTDLCFVNDGSSDGTGQALGALQRRNPDRIQVLALPRNTGKAEAVRQGCLHLRAQNRYQWLGYWDADLSTPLEEVQLLQSRRQEAAGDVVFILASRVKRLGADIERSSFRHLVGRLFATLASLLLRLPVYDSQCGAKLISPAGTDIALSEPFLTQWLFDVEILARLRNHFGRTAVSDKVLEVPLRSWREKGNSRLKWSDFLRVPFDLWKISRHYNARKTPPSQA